MTLTEKIFRMCSQEVLAHFLSLRWHLVTRLWPIGAGGSWTRTTLVGVAALLLGGCATPLTVSTAPPPELPVERWRGVTVAAEQRCAPYHSDEHAYPQAVEDDIIQRLGGIFSPYTNEVFDSKGDTDIEHVVARSEAHDSGPFHVSERRRGHGD